MHAGTFIEEIDAGHRRQRGGDAFFVTSLHVGELRIAHAGGGADSQAVEMSHLRAGRGDQRLFTGAARHGAGSEIGDEGPRPPNGNGARLDCIHIGKPRETFGDGLRDGAGKGRGCGGARLSGGEQQNRHAAAHRHFEAAAGILGEFHRRNDEAVRLRDEWPGPPFLFSARDIVKDLETFGDMLWRHHAGADMFRCARHAGIHGVDIEIMAADHVARRQRALIEMDMLALIDDARTIIEIDED